MKTDYVALNFTGPAATVSISSIGDVPMRGYLLPVVEGQPPSRQEVVRRARHRFDMKRKAERIALLIANLPGSERP